MGIKERKLFLSLSILACAVIFTGFVLVQSFDEFTLTKTTMPSFVYGPAIDIYTVCILSGAILIGVVRSFGRLRLALLLVWLIWLAVSTHRLVEYANGRVDDFWLSWKVQTIPANGADSDGASCRIGTWAAHCYGKAAERLVTFTPIPFSPLYPGLWAGQSCSFVKAPASGARSPFVSKLECLPQGLR